MTVLDDLFCAARLALETGNKELWRQCLGELELALENEMKRLIRENDKQRGRSAPCRQ